MGNSSPDKSMESLFDQFVKSFVENRDPRMDLELGALKQLSGIYLEKARALILERLKKSPDRDAIWSARVIELTDAIPIMVRWLMEIRSDPNSRYKDPYYRGPLAYTLYEFTRDETCISDLILTVQTEGYDEFSNGVSWLGKMPLTQAGMEAVWQRYKNGKKSKGTESWLDQCIHFLRDGIKTSVGEGFLKNLPEEDQRELIQLVTETRQDRIARNVRLEKYIKGRDRYYDGDLNRYDEYVKVGGSPLKGLRLKAIWKGHTHRIHHLAWSPDGKYLASTSDDESIMIWDLTQGECVKLLLREKKFQYSKYTPKHVVWMGKEMLACTYSYSSTPDEDLFGVAVWDIESEKRISPLQKKGENESFIKNLIYVPGSHSLLVSYHGQKDTSIYQLDPPTFKRKQILQDYRGDLDAMALSPDGNMITAGYKALTATQVDPYEIILLDARTWKVVRRLPGHRAHINQLCWLSTRPLLASASSDDTIGIWDLEHGQKLASIEGHKGIVGSVGWSAGGELLVSKSGEDHTVQIWNPRTWEATFVLREVDGYGDTVAFHPSLPILASICKDDVQEKVIRHNVNSIRIWEFDYAAFLDNPPFMNGFV